MTPSAKGANGRSIFVAEKKFAASVHGQAGVSCVDCHADLAKTTDFPHRSGSRPSTAPPATTRPATRTLPPRHRAGGRTPRDRRRSPAPTCHGGHDTDPGQGRGLPIRPGPPGRRLRDAATTTWRRASSPPSTGSCRARERPDPDLPVLPPAGGHRRRDHRRGRIKAVAGAPLHRLPRQGQGRPRTWRPRRRASSRPTSTASTERRSPAATPGRPPASTATARTTCGTASTRLVRSTRCASSRCARAATRRKPRSTRAASTATALRRGNQDAPACTDCHGEHEHPLAEGPDSPRSPPPTSRPASARPATPRCSVTEKWDLPARPHADLRRQLPRPRARGGVVEVANCASCHGTHDILPSSNPASRIAHGEPRADLRRRGLPSRAPTPGSRRARSTSRDRAGAAAPLLDRARSTSSSSSARSAACSLHNLLDFSGSRSGSMQIRRGEIAEPPRRPRALPPDDSRRATAARRPHRELHPARRHRVHAPVSRTPGGSRHPAPALAQRLRAPQPRSPHRGRRSWSRRASIHVGYVAFTGRGRQLVRDSGGGARTCATRRPRSGTTSASPRRSRSSTASATSRRAEYWALVWGTIVMGRHGDDHVVRQHLHRPAHEARLRRRPRDPLLRGVARDARDPRLALLLRDLQPRRSTR